MPLRNLCFFTEAFQYNAVMLLAKLPEFVITWQMLPVNITFELANSHISVELYSTFSSHAVCLSLMPPPDSWSS